MLHVVVYLALTVSNIEPVVMVLRCSLVHFYSTTILNSKSSHDPGSGQMSRNFVL